MAVVVRGWPHFRVVERPSAVDVSHVPGVNLSEQGDRRRQHPLHRAGLKHGPPIRLTDGPAKRTYRAGDRLSKRNATIIRRHSSASRECSRATRRREDPSRSPHRRTALDERFVGLPRRPPPRNCRSAFGADGMRCRPAHSEEQGMPGGAATSTPTPPSQNTHSK